MKNRSCIRFPKILITFGLILGYYSMGQSALAVYTNPGEISQFLRERSGRVVTKSSKGTGLTVINIPELTQYTLPYNGDGNPKISPDGQYVVYEGFGQKITIQGILPSNLNEVSTMGTGYFPHWWKDPATDALYVTYSNTNSSTPDTTTWKYKGTTYKQLIIDYKPVGEPVIILDQGFKGGLSRDGQWLTTADSRAMIYNTFTNKVTVLTYPRGNSACQAKTNPTTDVTRMDQVLFFNTWHDSLLIRNSKDSIVWSFTKSELVPLPKTIEKFHVNGWSNMEEFILTGARYYSGSEALYDLILINKFSRKFLWFSAGYFHDLWLDKAPEYKTGIAIKKYLSHEPLKKSNSLIITRLDTKESFTLGSDFRPIALFNLKGISFNSKISSSHNVNYSNTIKTTNKIVARTKK